MSILFSILFYLFENILPCLSISIQMLLSKFVLRLNILILFCLFQSRWLSSKLLQLYIYNDYLYSEIYYHVYPFQFIYFYPIIFPSWIFSIVIIVHVYPFFNYFISDLKYTIVSIYFNPGASIQVCRSSKYFNTFLSLSR